MRSIIKNALIAVGVVVVIVSLAGILFLMEGSVKMVNQPKDQLTDKNSTDNKTVGSEQKSKDVGVVKFATAEEFSEYLANSPKGNDNNYFGMVRQGMVAAPGIALEKGMATDNAGTGQAMPTNSLQNFSDRYSSTNVQVFGVDEPDIVKTDGNQIYISQSWFPIYYGRPMMLEKSVTGIRAPDNYPNYRGEVKVVNAKPPSDLKLTKKYSTYGNLLLSGNILMAFEGNSVKGFDVNASSTDKESWKITYPERDSLVGARLYGGKLYLATRQLINSTRPCPYEPFVAAGGVKVIVPCTAIYHPISPVQSDVVYTVSVFDAKTGKSESNISFVGSSSYSVLYMSEKAMYITYYAPGDMVKFAYNFFAENKDLIPAETLNRLGKLITYDISENAKQTEFYYIMSKLSSRFEGNDDERVKWTNQLSNALSTYYPQHRREFDHTSIAKVLLNDEFKVEGVGDVPGQLLNQFSLDEYENNLRVATTIGQNWFSIGVQGSQTNPVNDIYVLNDKMEKIGSVKDLGESERIYSARFIGDRGYVVTFRQTDPFYVLDLSNPKDPKLAGELKIPGYSSYLEPISKNIILGVGQESGQVKLALYDVSDPKQPNEVSKFMLDEYWSEALNNHHAFLKDEKYKVFFIPGNSGGYVFSYDNNKLDIKKAISGSGVQRALYIDDTLFVVAQNKLSAWNEKDWSKISELEFAENLPNPGPIIY